MVVVADMDLEGAGRRRRQQEKYSPAIRMGRAADDPIEIPRMACLDRPDVSPLPAEPFVFLLLSLSLLLPLLLLSLLLPLVVPPGLLLPGDAPNPGVAGSVCQYFHPDRGAQRGWCSCHHDLLELNKSFTSSLAHWTLPSPPSR